ncbi:hypothetical protein RFI_00662 [Reticulomyxa filosa]|uniref:Uncharacterized protein n=1 Tax=Reticulomyxa filosa TaxID=46433 RepID=X6PFG4_RETFI|nr:hypothetical protein RFI_00662 [Reticulomyxa filosa]|eukprot:ETO36397.1 hypothetical protein RFI_00662 [Reticulomyxa filosa]
MDLFSVCCVDFSSLQSNYNNKNRIDEIGGNGYTICSGSNDKTIRIWDIETAKQLIVLERHKGCINSVKYGPNELGISVGANTILSGCADKIDNIEVSNSSNVICSGSLDNTIRFWDIRSNKKELYLIKGQNTEDGILCLKFLLLK